MALEPASHDHELNDDGAAWCATMAVATYELDGGDFGTPGMANPECCEDADGDAYWDAACGGDDCDDADDGAFPGAEEVCDDGVDNDCDGLMDTDDEEDCPSGDDDSAGDDDTSDDDTGDDDTSSADDDAGDDDGEGGCECRAASGRSALPVSMILLLAGLAWRRR